MGGTDIGEADLKTSFEMLKAFNESRLGTASARIADVARDHTYTIIADPDHTNAAPYELMANPQTMSALANAGVRHIGVEMFMPSDQAMLDAYAKGEISDRMLDYAIHKMGPPSLVEDHLHLDDTPQEDAYTQLVQNARKYGIEVHGVNGSEGAPVPREQIDQYMQELGQVKLEVLKDIDKNPAFFDMSRKEQGEFVTKSLYDQGLPNSSVKSFLTEMGFRNIPGMTEGMGDDDFLRRRLGEDPILAQRIKDISGGEKTVVVYGQGHMLRDYGDVDANLPGSAVIDVYPDGQEAATDNYTKRGALQDLMFGQPADDVGDYKLDLSRGQWTDRRTGEVSSVVMPELPSIPGGTAPPPRPMEIATPQADIPALGR